MMSTPSLSDHRAYPIPANIAHRLARPDLIPIDGIGPAGGPTAYYIELGVRAMEKGIER